MKEFRTADVEIGGIDFLRALEFYIEAKDHGVISVSFGLALIVEDLSVFKMREPVDDVFDFRAQEKDISKEVGTLDGKVGRVFVKGYALDANVLAMVSP